MSLKGACEKCPSSADTLKNGVERMLKFYVPEVRSVVNVDEGKKVEGISI